MLSKFSHKINFDTQMGYANIEQQGEGLHLRQFSRAFIIEDENQNRLVFVSVDAAMMSHAVKRDVIHSKDSIIKRVFLSTSKF